MNLRDFEYIVAIAKWGTISRAAEICHVSQSTLSIQVKKLEAYLGIDLFERHKNRLTLTPAGRSVLHSAERILDESRRVKDVARQHQDPYSGVFRLGVFPTLGPYIIPKIMPLLSKAFPRLTVHLIEEKSPILETMFQNVTLDALLASLPLKVGPYETAHLFDDPFLFMCSRNHPYAKKKSLTLEDIAKDHLLLLDEGHCMRDQALEICNRVEASESDEFRATSLETLRAMVAAGTGVTLIPKIAVMSRKDLVYIPFHGDEIPWRSIDLYWRPSSPHQKLIQEIIPIIKNAVNAT